MVIFWQGEGILRKVIASGRSALWGGTLVFLVLWSSWTAVPAGVPQKPNRRQAAFSSVPQLHFEIPAHAAQLGPAKSASTDNQMPPGFGWHRLAQTQLAPLCPDNAAIQGNTGCRAVISTWSGGIADTRRNRLILWGGGHSDYFGNEVYALDLNRGTMLRLTDPSPVDNVNSCPEAYPDGRPVARHTYNGLVYLPCEDKMFAYGGGKSSCGSLSMGTWILDLSNLQWTRMDPHHGATPTYAPGVDADYDPNTGMIFLSDTANFFKYDPGSNKYTLLSELYHVDYHLTGVIDPERKLFLMFGGPGQLWAIDVGRHSNYVAKDWSQSAKGCDALTRAAYPGLAYDPVQKLVVGWAGGDTVYLFDPETRTCTPRTYAGGPGAAQEHGTNGRFRYFPELGIFAVVNDWKQDAFVLRLTLPSREAH